MLYDYDNRCPCGTGLLYGQCCHRYHAGNHNAPTAEALMRSRFCAFAIGDTNYLLDTWDADTRPAELNLDVGLEFYRLDILSTEGGGPFDTTGQVRFQAFYRGLADGVQEENSTFHKVDGRWVYSLGEVAG